MPNSAKYIPTVEGSCKAWGNFDFSQVPASLEESFNITTLTDSGVGLGVVTLTNPMNSSKYSVGGFAGENATGNNQAQFVGRNNSQAAVTVSAFPIAIWDNSGTLRDSNFVSINIFGNLS